MLLQDETSPVQRVTGGAGGEEGPLIRMVDPVARDARELGDLMLAREAELQPRGLLRKAEQRPEVGEHASIISRRRGRSH